MHKKDAKLLSEVIIPILVHSSDEPKGRNPSIEKDGINMGSREVSRTNNYYKATELCPEKLMENFCALIFYTKKLIQRANYNAIETEKKSKGYSSGLTPHLKIVLRLMKLNIGYMSAIGDGHIGWLGHNNLINPYLKLAQDIQPILRECFKIIHQRSNTKEEIENINIELVKKINSMAIYYQKPEFKRSRNGFESKPEQRRKSILKYLRKLFTISPILSVLRFDLLYVLPKIGEYPKNYIPYPGADELVNQRTPELYKLISIIKSGEHRTLDFLSPSLVGYMAICDYHQYKGMHFHVMLFLSEPLTQEQEKHAVDQIDIVWRSTTMHNLGFAYHCNEQSGSYRFSSIPTLYQANWFDNPALNRAIDYFTRPSHFFKLDTSHKLFFKDKVNKLK